MNQRSVESFTSMTAAKQNTMLLNIFICLVSLVALCNATVDVKLVASVDGYNDLSGYNSCSQGAPEGDCDRGQIGGTFAYVPSPNPDSEIRDELSDKDLLMLKSRGFSYWQSNDQDTLKQVLLIHRHGDRTPISFPPNDIIANEPFWQFHGLGQLTNRGKARLHVLGKIVRQRYDKFLQRSVNKNMRKSRSSGALRCIESAQVFLSSFLALSNQNSSDAEFLVWDKQEDKLSQIWQPASINTLSAKYDGLLNEGAECKNWDPALTLLDDSEVNKQLMQEYKHEREVMQKELGFEVDHFYKWFWASSVLEVERSYFESKMKPAVLAIYDRMQKAGDIALVLYQSSLKLRRTRVGLLIDDIIKNMMDRRHQSSSPFNKKFVHYSAHDINLIYLIGILENIDNFPYRPDYASNIIFELHEDKGEWFVKLFYMPHVPSKYMEMHIPACENGNERQRCTLDKFSELMKQYRVSSWWKWMQECENPVENMDPYEQNS